MNPRRAFASMIFVGTPLLLQSCMEYYPASPFDPPAATAPYPPQTPAAQQATEPLPPTPGPDDSLVAPIALYPDPLIALILPASTAPADLSAASAFLIQYGDTSRIDSQPWDPSVRALAHYPTVVTWMAANMEWTQALGAAFLQSPSEVMDAVQRLRARALASGALASTPQQQVYSDEGGIEIYPAQPDSVYVPIYDDDVVYADGGYNGYGGPYINFGEPYPSGPWLSFYFDWGHHRVWSGDQNVWREHRGWQPPRTGGESPPPGAHQWHPPPGGPGAVHPRNGGGGNAFPAPRPMPGAPPTPPARFRNPAVHPGTAAPQSSPVPRPRTAAPPPGHPRPTYSPLTAPPTRGYSEAPARASAPPASRPESSHASAPAQPPANNSNNQQPQR